MVIGQHEEPGFIDPRRPIQALFSAWGWRSFGEHEWLGGQGAAWCLYFDEGLLCSVRDVASEVVRCDCMTRWSRIAALIDRPL